MVDNIKFFIYQFTKHPDVLDINAYINYYKGLNVTSSFGVGVLGYVPFIAFLGQGEETQDGIYPVILFYRRRNIVVLAYGVSATNNPKHSWGVSAKTIGTLFEEKDFSGLIKSEKNYLNSFVYRFYPIDGLNVEKLVQDLDTLLDIYKKELSQYGIYKDAGFKVPPRSQNEKRELFMPQNLKFSRTKDEDALIMSADPVFISEHSMKSLVNVVPFSIKDIIVAIKSTGLIYSSSLIKRFVFSLMSKPFVILSGLAGSGKTQLALAFASAMVEDRESQLCMVSVGADWTNREPLLGFPNALQPGKYVRPESKVLDLLIAANKPENAQKPYFLILDEMNMSYVERYFADFLSAMESHEQIALWNVKEDDADYDNTPKSVALPKNLFIIGTINVDETTYMFSPKVLDRANVIEFKISSKEMLGFLKNVVQIDRDSINSQCAGMGADFIQLSAAKDLAHDDTVVSKLGLFFDQLKRVNAEFGYRSATEIFRFISQAQKNDNTDDKMDLSRILDAAIVQKLLPKLHGSRKKLEPVLQQLWRLCFDDAMKDTIAISRDNVEKAIYKESADKIQRMYDAAYANGFTSFAEA